MNADTARSIKQILDQRWYPQHQTLGEGGWPVLNAATTTWRTYLLLPPGNDEGVKVTAADDNAAWAAYDATYVSRGRVVEVIRRTRNVPAPR
jgi:hypothetical protein